jgi:hypothetical protein
LLFRTIGFDWDQGQHFHPDERFLTMVETAIRIPKSLSEYLDPRVSPMNPYNNNFGFFVYGVFPLNLTKILGQITHHNTYFNIHLLGRALSAIFDLGVVCLLFKLGRRILGENVGFLASFLYSIMVLPIQLSHFFAVDTFLNFFLILCFYLLIIFIGEGFPSSSPKNKQKSLDKSLLSSIALGTSFGLALACKITALYFLPIALLSLFFFFLKTKKIEIATLGFLLFIFFSYLSFRFNQPQAFANNNWFDLTINPKLANNLKELRSQGDPTSWFPPSVQWISTKPLIFPFENLVLWGLGFPLGIISTLGVVFLIFELLMFFINLIKKRPKENDPLFFQNLVLLLFIIWVFGIFGYEGTRFAKNIRYFLPIYPFLALISARLLWRLAILLKKQAEKYYYQLVITFFFLLLVYPLSFISIYTHLHSRVTASEWIYENIPRGSTISCEHWDDCLPVSLKDKSWEKYNYKIEALELFGQDVPEKWQKTNSQLEKIDYLIMSSNRLWGSIPKVPKRYPLTAKFYEDLFAEKLNFKKVAEITSYPCFPPIGEPWFCIPDQSAEESFTVYDHPKVLIYKKVDSSSTFTP